jgi:hopanoid biosynthesis associated protein HpnK
VTGDDFGASIQVNEAVERAHRQGILSATSLMVGAPAFEDAVLRARSLPSLHVGLHVVLVCGRPVLPPNDVPSLVGTSGDFSSDLVRAGFRYFFSGRARRELRAEIRAQFERFRATGLALDHVNAHNHMHLHPTVLGLILEVGKEYGLRAIRIPREPFLASWRATGDHAGSRLVASIALWPMIALMRARVGRAGIGANDYVFGMRDTGHMTAARMLQFLRHLPDGVSEVYCHPATGPWPGMDPAMADYRLEEELAALLDPAAGVAARESGAVISGFTELSPSRI